MLRGDILDKSFYELQNGSDIRGIALEGVEGQRVNLTGEKVKAISKAFAVWLSKRAGKEITNLRISIGMDSRLSSPSIKRKASEGLIDSGCNVYDFAMASTPAMFMSTVTDGYKYDGAVMITASHLPYNRNGMKFFTPNGGLEKEEITAVLDIAASGEYKTSNKKGAVCDVDFMFVYSKLLADKIRNSIKGVSNSMLPLKGFKIVVDAGNGAGGFFVEKVLKPLGADTSGSLFLDPDGRFPNHIPNPENSEAMGFIVRAVKEAKADLGIIFDADVDRAGAVTGSGIAINRNRLIAMMAAIVLKEHPNSIIVTDSVTSSGLKKFIEDLGGIHHRFKRGYKNVIDEGIRLNSIGKECYLAMETSGHGALKENYFLDDGAYLVTKILIAMANLKLKEGKNIETIIEKLEEPLEAKEFRLKISTDDFREYGSKIISDLGVYVKTVSDWKVEPKNYEGIRVSIGNDDGWFLLRLSLHEPLMPLNIESNSRGGVKAAALKLLKFLKNYKSLDLAPIEDYVK
jgi:phosphomannomutase